MTPKSQNAFFSVVSIIYSIACPRKPLYSPSSSSMLKSSLYLQILSVRESEPVLICPHAGSDREMGYRGIFCLAANGAILSRRIYFSWRYLSLPASRKANRSGSLLLV